MKIELKKVKTFPGHDGKPGLDAEVWIDNKLALHVHDDARGGCYNYSMAKNGPAINAILPMLEIYAKSLPARPLEMLVVEGQEPVTFQPDIDTLIDDAFAEYERSKFTNKMQKDMEKNIVFGKPGGDSYRKYYLLGKPNLSMVPREMLQRHVDSVKRMLVAGEQILNTNLVSMGIAI